MKQKASIEEQAGSIWRRFTSSSPPGSPELELAFYKKLLGYLQAGSSYYFTYNFNNVSFEVIDPEIERVLGFAIADISMDTVLTRIHPEDMPYFLAFENKVVEFFLQLPKEKITRYKARYDLRIQNKEGHYIRLLHQALVANHDDDGKIARMFCLHTDITYLKQQGQPQLSFIGMEGEPSYHDMGTPLLASAPAAYLSRREKQVLALLAEGKASKEIAAALHISKPTVDTHRRNMLAKNGVASTGELVGKAIRSGWI